jgi:hypothetical protein
LCFRAAAHQPPIVADRILFFFAAMAESDPLLATSPEAKHAAALREAYERARKDGWTVMLLGGRPILMPPHNPRDPPSKVTMPKCNLGTAERIDGRPILFVNDFYKTYMPERQLSVMKTLIGRGPA